MKWLIGNVYITALVVLLAVPFIGWYIFAAMIDPDSGNEMSILISQVKQRDAEIAVYLLRSRSHIDNDFDKLAKAQKNMEEAMVAFKVQLTELNTAENKQATIVYFLYEDCREKLERFKTLHAKLSNSLRFLPKLNKKLRAASNQTKADQEILGLAEGILISTFSLRLFGDDAMLEQEYTQIELLKKLKSFEQNNSLTELLNPFIHHTEMFIQFRQKEAQIVQLIFENKFSIELASLEQQMRKRHAIEYEEYTTTRYYLIGYSVLLFLVILLFILNRHRLLKKVSIHQMLSEKDQLTGLSNRRHFIQELERVLSTPWQNGLCSAIVFIDLDGFKAVNDNLGHNAGDIVLQRISKRLLNQSRLNQENGINNFVARLGGDEFVILLENLNKNNISENLNKVVEQTLLLCSRCLGTKYKPFPLTASLGVVTFSDQSKSIADLLHCADLAMYQSKKEGKNRCNFYEH